MTENGLDLTDVAKRIREYVIEDLLLGDGTGLTDDVSLLESGILDSTGVVELVDFLEESFNLSISPNDLSMENLGSIDRAARFVVGKQHEG